MTVRDEGASRSSRSTLAWRSTLATSSLTGATLGAALALQRAGARCESPRDDDRRVALRRTSEPERSSAVRAIHPYLDVSDCSDRLSGGVRLVPITTPVGEFRVWTKRVGRNPRCRVLLLHGGPGATHTYLEALDSYLPAAGIEYYHYDQLGSGWSDRPNDPSLWQLDRFVDEVEQVRNALGLTSDSFVLYGHSWGGILAIEYALRHGDALHGLVISNMMASVPAYNAYAAEVLKPSMDPTVVREIGALEAEQRWDEPRYMELLIEHHYVHHVLRLPYESWPWPVVQGFRDINPEIYVRMQGPSELGIAADATLAQWDRFEDLVRIDVPTLVIGATYDTMDPRHMASMAARLPRGSYLECPNGSHLALYDDQETYM